MRKLGEILQKQVQQLRDKQMKKIYKVDFFDCDEGRAVVNTKFYAREDTAAKARDAYKNYDEVNARMTEIDVIDGDEK